MSQTGIDLIRLTRDCEMYWFFNAKSHICRINEDKLTQLWWVVPKEKYDLLLRRFYD